MKDIRYDPGYHLDLSARAQLQGVREGDPDETRTLLHGFVEEAASDAGMDPETLDLVAWMIGRVLDGADPVEVFTPPPLESGADSGKSARKRLQQRRHERMIRLVAEDARAQLTDGGDEAKVIERLALRSKLPKGRIRAALKKLPPGPS